MSTKHDWDWNSESFYLEPSSLAIDLSLCANHLLSEFAQTLPKPKPKEYEDHLRAMLMAPPRKMVFPELKPEEQDLKPKAMPSAILAMNKVWVFLLLGFLFATRCKSIIFSNLRVYLVLSLPQNVNYSRQ